MDTVSSLAVEGTHATVSSSAVEGTVPSPANYKIFNDPVHGKIRLHPLLVNIIDTPQFQRLRNIKQLGGVYYVYPGASHNRFEHSIGTCHLAGLLARHLQKQLKNDKHMGFTIDEKDVLCVEIAALCHDLGHGPFSHAFDNNFIKKVKAVEAAEAAEAVEAADAVKTVKAVKDTKWTHEVMSITLFEYMLSNNDKLQRAWKDKKYGMTDEDETFIKTMINPPNDTGCFKNTGRDIKKAFLYEIVSNKITSIDVDKFDYFARDALHLGLHSNFDHMRYINSARVLFVDETKSKTRICCRERDLDSLYDLFHIRHLLHRKAYQHKNTKIVEEMIVEAFLEADKTDFFSYPNASKKMKLSETIKDAAAYTYVTDHVFHQILCSTADNGPLKSAREILEKVNIRELYTCIGATVVTNNEPIEKMKAELKKRLAIELKEKPWSQFNEEELENQFVIVHIEMNYGMKENDPLKKLAFYRKDEPNKLLTDEDNQLVSQMILPKVFMEVRLIAYYKGKIVDNCKKDCQEAFRNWCRDKTFSPLMDV